MYCSHAVPSCENDKAVKLTGYGVGKNHVLDDYKTLVTIPAQL